MSFTSYTLNSQHWTPYQACNQWYYSALSLQSDLKWETVEKCTNCGLVMYSQQEKATLFPGVQVAGRKALLYFTLRHSWAGENFLYGIEKYLSAMQVLFLGIFKWSFDEFSYAGSFMYLLFCLIWNHVFGGTLNY